MQRIALSREFFKRVAKDTWLTQRFSVLWLWLWMVLGMVSLAWPDAFLYWDRKRSHIKKKAVWLCETTGGESSSPVHLIHHSGYLLVTVYFIELYREDSSCLQEDLNSLSEWASIWQLNFNVNMLWYITQDL